MKIKQTNTPFSNISGFTLIELLLVMIIVAVALAVGIPSLMEGINNQKLTAQANDMIASLNMARSESIKRSLPVTIKKSTTWTNGWTIFEDVNGNGTQDGGDATLRQIPPLTSGSVNISSTNFANYITYTANGRSNTLGEFKFCPATNASNSRRVIIAGSGRMRTVTEAYATNCP